MAKHNIAMNSEGVSIQTNGDSDDQNCQVSYSSDGNSSQVVSDSASVQATNAISLTCGDYQVNIQKDGLQIKNNSGTIAWNDDGITLNVGSSKIELTSDGITITGNTVNIKGTQSISMSATQDFKADGGNMAFSATQGMSLKSMTTLAAEANITASFKGMPTSIG
ncbi:type VI secretion system tip protein TssI/VgrG [Vibrio marisflavi]|uniref:Uncharacterized protein n=1 Tax=Vibrio marisflavi CECT 7928 TaxID=634439 RepID=A0ABM9A2R6_9VIBR|nr:type VI secretion system tip protein TssI/VgrG [Vibrio marisflavi]CAH0538620.1 hypothetical protein VMF7928_01551 [Vibrio marisflavi CECT 7928]